MQAMAWTGGAAEEGFNVNNFFLGPSTIVTQHGENGAIIKSGIVQSLNQRIESRSTSPSVTITSRISKSSATSGVVSKDALDDESAMDRQPSRMPPTNGHIAFGSIYLYKKESDATQMYMRGKTHEERYPSQLLNNARDRGWIQIHEILRSPPSDSHYLRIYVLPEDVDRGNRGSLKDFRKMIRFLLNLVDPSVAAWRGEFGVEIQFYDLPQTRHEESLFYIFNTLRSPSPNLNSVQKSIYGYQAVHDIINDNITGLKTELYSYQRRSVATMVQRETDPANLIDPRKTALRDIHGQPFYLDFHDGTLLKTPHLYNEPQGGILAETMGYGKTLICLALVLATRGHYPKVPEDRVDGMVIEPRERVGSLLAMAARWTKHNGVPWKVEFQNLKRQGYHFDSCLNELNKYERAYAEPIFTPTTPNRTGKRESANIVHLCSATLIIVPPNLLVQWRLEIVKHVEEDALDVLIIDSPTKQIPEWRELIRYDVVLTTKSRFEQEYRDDDLNQGKMRVGDARYRSPLTAVRWLRVICDEGHGFAGSSCRTNAMAMLDKMFIERRWVVSGTPSSTLHGVEIGLSTTTSSPLAQLPNSETLPKHGRRQSINTALQKRRASTTQEQESKDLDRLRLIVVNFLRLQPWANQRGTSDIGNWKKYLAPTVDENGERRSSLALREVLQTLIIRHRIEDIDTDLTLPPLHHRTIYLIPSYHDKLSINMFMLVLASNYVTSEREDEDYMFHPKNRKKFDMLVSNLRQASFHWTGFSEHDVRETLRISNEYLDKHIDVIGDDDALLLTEAIMNGERALGAPSWLAFSKMHEIGVYMSEFPKHAREAWALDGRSDDPLLLGTVQARSVQEFYTGQVTKGVQSPLSGLAGKGLKVMAAARKEADDETKDASKGKTTDSEKQQIGALEERKLKVGTATLASRVRSAKRPSSGSNLQRNHTIEATSPSLTSPTAIPSNQPPTRVAGFTSSKLTYLVDQLLIHSPTSKSIIFYSSNNTAFWIAEALQLMRIPFLIYANTLSMTQRNDYLAMFNSDRSIRVLLMDLKQASHGLHVACANRVYIVAPIWDKSVESQAVKRAHRIGQMKEVFVETLVLKGTFEEEMVIRRHSIDDFEYPDASTSSPHQPAVEFPHTLGKKNHGDVNFASPVSPPPTRSQLNARQKMQSLLDDRHMIQVLKNINFLKFSAEEDDEVSARVARLISRKEKRMLFGNAVVESDDVGHLDGMSSGVNREGLGEKERTRGLDAGQDSIAFQESKPPKKRVRLMTT